MIKDYAGKKILVLGLARSGFAAARLLVKLGAQVAVSEAKPPEELKEYAALTAMGVRVLPQTPEVFEAEYDQVIKNPGINGNLWFVRRLRERGIPVITEIELAFNVCAPQHYIGVTGTNGKTTTCTLLCDMLSRAFPGRAHLTGNIGVALCETALENDLLQTAGHYIVLEISNFQLLDIERFRPSAAAIINLAPDHIDFMGSEDNYYRSKCRIYENMSSEDVFLKNIDDPVIADYTAKLPVPARTLTFSTKRAADVYADDRTVFAFGEPLLALSEIKIPGRHNVQNVLTAAGLALAVGAPREAVAGAIRDFRGVEHRIEFIREKDGVRYYNDSKGTNVDATVTAVNAFDSPVILLAGGYEKQLSFAPLRPLLPKIKQVVGFGACGPRLVAELTDGAGILTPDLPAALAAAVRIAAPGDVILLSPTTSSFDQYPCFEARGDHFRQLVNDL